MVQIIDVTQLFTGVDVFSSLLGVPVVNTVPWFWQMLSKYYPG